MEDKKKILIVYKTSHINSFGGVESFLKGLIKYIDKSKFKIRLINVSDCKNKIGVRKFYGAEIYTYKESFNISSNNFSFELLSNFKKHADWADLIHYNFPWPTSDFIHFLFKIKKPYIISYHADIVRQKFLLIIYKPLMFNFLRGAKCVITSSPNYKKSSRILGELENVITVPYGIEEPKYTFKKSIKLFNNNFYIFVGVLRYYKNLPDLFEAFKNLNQNLVVLGHGPLSTNLNNYLRKNNIKNIIILGESDNDTKYTLMKNSIAVILPSKNRAESFGFSLLEGAALKKALISCDINSGMSYINKHNITGLHFKPNNIDSLKKQIIKLSNSSIARTFGLNAFRRYQNLFSINKMVNSYENIYLNSYK